MKESQFKVYSKRGVHGYKEKKLEKALEDFFEKNPDKYAGYVPPSNYDDLKATHDRLCIESVDYEEIKDENAGGAKKSDHENFRNSISPEPEETERGEQTDPINRQEPNIRDYVTNESFKDERNGGAQQQNSTYEEPKSFRESFDIPPEAEEGGGNANNTGQPITGSQQKQQKQQAAPDPDAKVKKKSKRKFTKYAVDAVCALAERGIVWWTTKDFTDKALAEQIENDEIAQASLDMLVLLDSGTKGTVRQFFQQNVRAVQTLSKFTPEEKEDLVEALDDFLEYKKVEINPTVNLLVIAAGIMFDRMLGSIAIKMQTGSVLAQLKDQYAEYKAEHGSVQPSQSQESNEQQQEEQHEEQSQEQESEQTADNNDPEIAEINEQLKN